MHADFDDVCCACWRWRGDWTVCVARRSQFPEVHPLATSLSSPNYSPARTSTAPIPAHTTLPRFTMTSHQSPSTHAPSLLGRRHPIRRTLSLVTRTYTHVQANTNPTITNTIVQHIPDRFNF